MIRVLIVDDDYRVAHLHARCVTDTDGYAVVGEAHSGAEAFELIHATAPDLLLLDMYLPDCTGLELMRRLSATTTEQIPDFLLLTAARDIESIRTAMQLGAFYYLVKPFTLEALREQLQAYSAWAQRLNQAPEGDQQDVDALYRLRGAPTRPTIPARPLEPTTARVLEIITAASAPLGSAEVADLLGASRPTAQRHLAELVKNQLIDLELTYGTTGRPQHRYSRHRR